MDRKTLVPTLILSLATVAGASAYVAKTSAANTTREQSMVSSLSQKLGVDQTKVSDAFNQIHADNQAARDAQISSNLDKAVTDGVITADQKQKLLDKEKENRAAEEKIRSDMQQWLTDNGIDMSKLQSYGIGGPGGGFGKGRHMGI